MIAFKIYNAVDSRADLTIPILDSRILSLTPNPTFPTPPLPPQLPPQSPNPPNPPSILKISQTKMLTKKTKRRRREDMNKMIRYLDEVGLWREGLMMGLMFAYGGEGEEKSQSLFGGF